MSCGYHGDLLDFACLTIRSEFGFMLQNGRTAVLECIVYELPVWLQTVIVITSTGLAVFS